MNDFFLEEEAKSNNNQYVTLTEISEQLGLDRSSARKYILNLNFTNPFRIRTKESGNQLCLAWSVEDAEKILQERKKKGFFDEVKVENSLDGFFYLIKIIPELSKKRVKLGFSSNFDSRLNSHRCISPTLEVIKVWECKRYWEPVLIDLLETIAVKKYSSEVFDFDCIDELIKKTEAFFSLHE